MMEFDDTDVMLSSREAFYDEEFVFDGDGRLTFAFGITAYDNEAENIEDPSYGTIKVFNRNWGLKSDQIGTSFDELPKRPCTEAELHING